MSFGPYAIGTRDAFLSSDNMLIEWAVIDAVKQCSKFVECIFQIANISKSYHKTLAPLCHQELVEQM